jgi:tripartite-type tricarboxylate transporter receptor subunit TctC
LGYGVTHAIWHAVSAPAGTAPAVVATLRRGLQAMVGDDGFKAALQKLGERPQHLDSEALEQFLAQDYQKVGRSYGRSFGSKASGKKGAHHEDTSRYHALRLPVHG